MEMIEQRSSSTSRELGSSLPVVVKAIWQVLKNRDFQNFGRVLDFLELIHEQAPGLLCYRHHAKLSTGLRGKMVLNMIEEKKPLLEILKALNNHFPPVFSDDYTASHRDLSKARQVKVHFRKLVLRMIRDEKFRQNYVATTLNSEYGEQFMDVLEKLLWEFLYRLQTVLHHQVPKSTETPVVEDEHPPGPPILADSGLLNISSIPGVIYTEDRSAMVQNRERPLLPIESSTSEEEERAGCEIQQHCLERKGVSCRCGGSGDDDQIVSQSEGLEERSFTRRREDPACGGATAGCNLAIREHQSPYFDIFGFDYSERSRVKPFRKRSPPEPLQTPETNQETDHVLGQDLDSYSLHDWMAERSTKSLGKIQSGEQVPSECPIKIPAHGKQEPVSHVSIIVNKEQGAESEPSLPGLMSWWYQPRVYMTPLPLNLISKYLRREPTQVESLEGDLSPQAAELSQYTTHTDLGSWLWDSSVPTDNDSSDPDYSPGYNSSFHDEQQESTTRILRSSSLS